MCLLIVAIYCPCDVVRHLLGRVGCNFALFLRYGYDQNVNGMHGLFTWSSIASWYVQFLLDIKRPTLLNIILRAKQ
jgi:hypothetical protein